MTKKDSLISIGIVIKSFHQLSNLEKVHEELKKNYNYFEIILVNLNQPKNKFNDILKNLSNIRIIELSTLVDVEVANTVIIENCIGDYCVIMDTLHDSVEDMRKILIKSEKHDLVIGKTNKKIYNSIIYSIASYSFYKIINIFTGLYIDRNYSDFFVINRYVINFINNSDEKIKFLKFLKFKNNFKKGEYIYTPMSKTISKRTFLQNINFTY